MKLSGTAALYTQLKELQAAVAVTEKQIAMAEELLEEKPAKVKKTRKARTPKVNGGLIAAQRDADGEDLSIE